MTQATTHVGHGYSLRRRRSTIVTAGVEILANDSTLSQSATQLKIIKSRVERALPKAEFGFIGSDDLARGCVKSKHLATRGETEIML